MQGVTESKYGTLWIQLRNLSSHFSLDGSDVVNTYVITTFFVTVLQSDWPATIVAESTGGVC